MLRLKTWQGLILAVPIAAVVIFLIVAASFQINQWGLNWIWAVFTLIFVAWRFLLVKWTRPVVGEIEATIGEIKAELTQKLKSYRILIVHWGISKDKSIVCLLIQLTL